MQSLDERVIGRCFAVWSRSPASITLNPGPLPGGGIMKCLHCGNESERLNKWRGSAEFCSENCRKEYDEECNRIAISRLMRTTRTPRVRKEAAVNVIAGDSVAVAEAVAPAKLEEPPLAEFVVEARATLAVLQARSPSPLPVKAVPPQLPDLTIEPGDTFRELQSRTGAILPRRRGPRDRRFAAKRFLRIAPYTLEADALPTPDLAWRTSLGIVFQVDGFAQCAQIAPPRSGAQTAKVTPAAAVHHRAIPTLRPRRQLPAPLDFLVLPPAAAAEPNVAPPRLRIHLPKPSLLPLRPRYTFAPAPPEHRAKQDEIPLAAAPATENHSPTPDAVSPKPAEESVDMTTAPRPVVERRLPKPRIDPQEKPAPSRATESQDPAIGKAGASETPASTPVEANASDRHRRSPAMRPNTRMASSAGFPAGRRRRSFWRRSSVEEPGSMALDRAWRMLAKRYCHRSRHSRR
jgi:hypothetical protein